MTRDAETGSRPSVSVVVHVFICPSVRLRELCGSVGKNRASLQHLENLQNMEAFFRYTVLVYMLVEGEAKIPVAHKQNVAVFDIRKLPLIVDSPWPRFTAVEENWWTFPPN